MKSQERYVESIEKKYRKRKVTAILTLAIWVFYGAASAWFFEEHVRNSENFKKLIVSAAKEPIDRRDSDKYLTQMIDISRQWNTFFGVYVGATAASFAFSMAHIFYLLFGSRKERILLELYERQKT